jgi:hypothetical protein
VRVERIRDGAGAVVGLTGGSLDVTDEKRVEARLRGSGERMRALVARLQEIQAAPPLAPGETCASGAGAEAGRS